MRSRIEWWPASTLLTSCVRVRESESVSYQVIVVEDEQEASFSYYCCLLLIFLHKKSCLHEKPRKWVENQLSKLFWLWNQVNLRLLFTASCLSYLLMFDFLAVKELLFVVYGSFHMNIIAFQETTSGEYVVVNTDWRIGRRMFSLFVNPVSRKESRSSAQT
jgi:hypothetical protein